MASACVVFVRVCVPWSKTKGPGGESFVSKLCAADIAVIMLERLLFKRERKGGEKK